MKMITFEPDVLWNLNNSTLFVVPISSGRLGAYAITGEFGAAGWVFSDDAEIPDYVKSGSAQDGDAFLERCEALGMVVVQVNNLNVPFSSGRRRSGPNAGSFQASEFRTLNAGWLEKIEREVFNG